MLTFNSTYVIIINEVDLMSIFGEKLKQLRVEKKITQRSLAEKIGVDFSYISKIETGALEPPSEEVIIKIAKALNANEEDLILLAKKMPTSFQERILEHDISALFLRKVSNLTQRQKDEIKKIIEED